MKPKSFMIIAGEASGDVLAAELVSALRSRVLRHDSASTADLQPLETPLMPRFFGAGGPKMAAAGVELAFDLTQHAMIGVPTVGKYLKLRRILNQLVQIAITRQPDAIVCVDYNYFNLKFAEAVRQRTRRSDWFHPWRPKIVKFISPQVWASRESRAYRIAEDFDLLLSIFPFEKEWYARRTPKLRVEFVGHPMVERLAGTRSAASQISRVPTVVLLPGSRAAEVRRHWPVVAGAFQLMREKLPNLRGKMILPNESLAQSARSLGAPAGLEIQVGGISAALAEADLAITKSGTITMECAYFGVPAVVFYKTSWLTYLVGKQIVSVKYLAMPNLFAGEEVFPEFIQHAATPENISRTALDLLENESRHAEIKRKLAEIIASLGGPGASDRAAATIMKLLP